ncbi:MAG: SDR family oxidoreductase [Methyloligellaceae bacterium]
MKSRAALITGAARRVGREIARHLAREGWDIGIHYGTSEAEAESLAGELRQSGREARTYQGDLREAEAPADVVARFFADFPVGSLLVNNASLFEHDTIETFKLERWHDHLAVNALAPTLLMKAFHEGAAETTCMINLLDQKVTNVTTDYFSYTVSKLALLHITKTLAQAYCPKSRVNAIAPGLLLPSGEQTVEDYDRVHDQTPLGVGATVAEICHAVAFIASTPAMTGQVITIDGGEHMVRPASPNAGPGGP